MTDNGQASPTSEQLLISPAGAAKMLDVSTETIRRMVRRGDLVTVAAPVRPKVTLASLHEFVARAQVEQAPK